MKRPAPMPPPLPPLPRAIEVRVGVQMLAEHSWVRWEHWQSLPVDVWPDLALLSFWQTLGADEFPDMTAPTGGALREIVRAHNAQQELH